MNGTKEDIIEMSITNPYAGLFATDHNGSRSSKHKTFCAATVANKLRKRRAKSKSAKVARRKMKVWGTALRRQRLYNTAISGLQPLIVFLKDRRKILKHLSENKDIIQKQFPSGGITSRSSESILRYSK